MPTLTLAVTLPAPAPTCLLVQVMAVVEGCVGLQAEHSFDLEVPPTVAGSFPVQTRPVLCEPSLVVCGNRSGWRLELRLFGGRGVGRWARPRRWRWRRWWLLAFLRIQGSMAQLLLRAHRIFVALFEHRLAALRPRRAASLRATASPRPSGPCRRPADGGLAIIGHR